MNILVLLIPIAIAIAGGFVFAFIWATNGGQYDDLETPAFKMLLDDEQIINKSQNNKKE